MAAGESSLIQALRQAVLAAPDRAEFRTALAEALLAAGDTDSAIVELGEALRVDPASGTVRDLMLTALGAKNAARAAGAAPPDAPPASGPGPDLDDFDWAAAEAELEGMTPPPRFAHPDDGSDD